MKRASVIAGVSFLFSALLAAEGVHDGEIPYGELSARDAEEVRNVVKHRTIRRSLTEVEFVGTSQVYAFLLERLPFAAAGIRALGVQNYRVEDNGDGTFTADDGAGATGVFRLVYEEPGKKIYYAEGRYDGKVIKVKGKAVAVVEFVELPDKKMKNWVSFHFRFDSVIVGTVVKVISCVIGPLVDSKIQYFLDAAQNLCKAIVENPEVTYTTLRRAGGINAEELAEFRKTFLNTQTEPRDRGTTGKQGRGIPGHEG